MIAKLCLMLAVFSVMPIWAQTDTSGQGSSEESPMVAPPPVSGQAFSTTPISEERSNYLSLGITGGAGYVTNVFPGAGSIPISDETYSIWPTVAFDRTNFRLHETFTYSPGFTFFQHTTALNQVSQNASGQFQYSPTEHSNVRVSDNFEKSSDVFSSPYSIVTETVSGSSAAQVSTIIVPYADIITNTASAGYSYQPTKAGMIGVAGALSELDYTNPNQATGLYNANTYTGSGFYSNRISSRQYLGALYAFTYITEYGSGQTDGTATNAFSAFYTFYPSNKVSLSISGGPEYYRATVPATPIVTGWTPNVTASASARLDKAIVSISYQHSLTAGGGLAGAFRADSCNAGFNLQLSRNWAVGVSGGYTNDTNVLPSSEFAESGGHSLTATSSVHRTIGAHLSVELGYSYLNQNYTSVAAVSTTPDAQRVYGTISYQLRRPLGR